MAEPTGAATAAPPADNPWASRTVTVGPDGVARCAWGMEDAPLYRAYHDEEWA